MNGDYKDAQKAVADLKAGDVRGIEPAIHFLNADVIEFRSGYLKSISGDICLAFRLQIVSRSVCYMSPVNIWIGG